MKYIMVWTGLFLLLPSAWAMDVEGVHVAEQVVVEGKTLQLNGAGMRTKFFFDIYVGALYLAKAARSTKAVLEKPNPARVSMDIVYGEVDKEKLIKGWNAGFKKNQGRVAYAALEERLYAFNRMFSDMHKGDRLVFDFLSNGATKVTIKGRDVGSVIGLDFQQALLSVWLGDKPADSSLKWAMLKGGTARH